MAREAERITLVDKISSARSKVFDMGSQRIELMSMLRNAAGEITHPAKKRAVDDYVDEVENDLRRAERAACVALGVIAVAKIPESQAGS